MRPNKLRELLKSNKPTLSTHIHTTWPSVVEAVASAPAVFRVRVWHITSRGWDPWTERPLPEVVRVAYPPDAVHNHFFPSRHLLSRERF